MGVVTLSARERKRLELLSRVKEGVLKLVQAAGLCGLSYRQVKRVWKRHRGWPGSGRLKKGNQERGFPKGEK